MLAVIYRSLVSEYYRQNAGFFLVILMLAFGILRSDHHIALFMFVMSSPGILLYIVLGWAVYTIKSMGFIRSQFRHPAYSFLYHLRTVSLLRRYGQWFLIQVGLQLPVIAYAFWMSFSALKTQQWFVLGNIIFAVLLLCILPVLFYERILRNSSPEVQVRSFIRNWALPYPLFFIQYLLRQKALLVLLTKLFSGAVLAGVCLLYPTDDYDERLLSLGLLIGSLAHLGIIHEGYLFEHSYLLLLKNLPHTFVQRFGHQLIQVTLLFLPELILLFRYLPTGVSFLYVAKAFVFSSGMWLAAINRLYQHHQSNEQQSMLGLWGFIGGLLLIMFRIDASLIGAALWSYAIWANRMYYYHSEYIVEP
ncbi:MAG: hypothetical protein QM669_00770 [Siphonobacter sp.]